MNDKSTAEDSDLRERRGPKPVSARHTTLRVVCWIITGVAVYGLRYELGVFGGLMCGAFLVVATVATIAMLAAGTITRTGAVLLAAALLGLFCYGGSAARLARFCALKSGYEAIVNEAEQGLTDRGGISLGRSDFFIDENRPVRVAFPWTGIVDNWCGVVFDPTDELSRFCGDAGRDSHGFLKEPALRRLFGGDMIYCERLEKGWYFCWFT